MVSRAGSVESRKGWRLDPDPHPPFFFPPHNIHVSTRSLSIAMNDCLCDVDTYRANWSRVQPMLTHAVWMDGSDYLPGAHKTMVQCPECGGNITLYRTAAGRLSTADVADPQTTGP